MQDEAAAPVDVADAVNDAPKGGLVDVPTHVVNAALSELQITPAGEPADVIFLKRADIVLLREILEGAANEAANSYATPEISISRAIAVVDAWAAQ